MNLAENSYEWPPCRYACPVHADVRTYIKHIAMGRYPEALEVIRRHLPFAAVCGRVCHHPCEKNCRRREVEGPLAIRELKRFVAEHPGNDDFPVQSVQQDKARVAIIGGGPSGMSSALELARKGYRPCIYEKEEKGGGIPMRAIPSYRLPETVLQRDIDWILAHGIELQTGIQIGKDKSINDLHREGYAAVIIAAGMSSSRILPLPGKDHPRVLGVLAFLNGLKSDRKLDIGKDVLVIGGGNVACDAARSAVRQGCERVQMICLENRAEMPAWDEEIEEAIDEGINIITRRGPLEIVVDESGNLAGLKHQKVTAVFDEQGRFNPSFDPADVTVTSCDTVIFAIGQAIDPNFIQDSGLELDQQGRLPLTPATQQTDIDWIFACGEVVTPPGSIVEACASGCRAGEAVIQFLETGEVEIDDTLPEPISRIDSATAKKISRLRRVEIKTTSPEARKNSFSPYVETLEEFQAVGEARRCLECGSGAVISDRRCVNCLTCVRLCPYDAPQLGDHVYISSERCQACGICYSECPATAICLKSGEPEKLRETIDTIVDNLADPSHPKVIAYIGGRETSPQLCSGEESLGIPNCAQVYLANPGMLDSIHILNALESGADAVFIAVQDDSHEHHKGTCDRLRRKVARLQDDLETIGLNREQVQIFEMEDRGGDHVKELLGQGIERLVQSRE